MQIAKFQLEDGRIASFEVPDGISPEAAQRLVAPQLAELSRTPAEAPKPVEEGLPEGGFVPAVKAGISSLKGNTAAVLGRVGAMDIGNAEQYIKEQEDYQKRTFKPSEQGWSEAPFTKFKETLGGSLPYIAAPAVAAVTALALPEAAVAAGAVTAASSLASYVQFVGSNLSRQMDEGKKLSETELGYAALSAIPQTALDVLSLKMLPGIGKIFGSAGKELTEEMAQKIAAQGLAKIVGEYTAKTGKAIGMEGLTEAAQQVFERLQAGLNITDEDAKKEYLESFIGGAVLGGVLAPVGNAFRRAGQAPKVAALEEQRLLRGKETDFETLKAKKLAEIREAGGVPEEDKPPEVDLNNIIGSISKEELHPEIVQHIDEHRKNMGHVPLSSYTTEDVKDAMPGTSPEHQQAIIDSILANKTKYRGDVQYTPDSLQTAAAGKNIDTKTQGFKDFLARTTGIEDESQMSQQQLHAAVTALTAMPKSEVIRSLPEGTNATRFSDAQYNNVVSKLQNENLGKYTRDDLVAKIKDISSLENNKDAHAILNKAIKDDEIDVNKTPQYDVVNPATNEIIASPSKKDVAQALADKNKFEMRESEKENFSLPQKEAYLPVGLEIKEEEVQDGEKPAGFEIRANDKVLSEAATQEEAQQKAADFTEVRRSALDEATKAMFKLQSGISASNKIITKLEATGKIGTPEYAKAKEAHDRLRQDSFKKINALRQDAVGYSKPVSVAPVAARPLMRKAHAVYEKGIKKTVASTRMAAERHILSTASDETLKQIAADKRPNRMTTKANKELAKRGVPQRDEVAAKAEAAELTQIQQLEASLVPTLAKFGLKDVALKVMKAINGNAEGSYESKLIKIALDSTNPMRVLRHESIHALKELGFFTPNQWKALENQARTQWIGKYLQNRNINGEKLQAGQQSRYDAYMDVYKGDMNAVVEEAIADAFGDFDVNGAPAGAMGKLMDMIRNFFVSLGNALRGAGFQTFEDVFGKVERGELKAGKAEAAGAKLSVGEESRGYKLEIEREKRKLARSASMSEDEFNAVARDAAELGMDAKQVDAILKGIRSDKKRFPASQGWDGLEVTGIQSKVDDDGKTIPGSESPKYKPISYGYNVPPGATKAPVKMDQAWLDKVAIKFQSQIEEIYKRAASGDVNAKNIIAHKSWYKNVATTLREEYGGFGDTLADLLGATSPNTPVDTNWRFSMEIMRRFVRGDFNADMAKFVKHIDSGKSASDFPAADKIRQVSQKLYGMNSTNSMLALSDMWRMIKPGQAPKARNFALNLIGQSNMATIDVWAARMLRRAADMIDGSYPRIPPPAEQGVSGTWNSKATSVTGAFGFGAEVMRKTSDNLRKKGILIDPPDLQAIAWFAEKELWGTKGWTTKTGEGGSFEENIEAQPAERYIAGNAIQVGKVAPSQVDIKDSQKRILDILNEDKSVIASRSKQTKGLYGGIVEQSFDTEWVVEKGKFKPNSVISEIAQISKDHGQFDFFVSKVLGKDEKSLNARPGVEIYFKTKQDMDTVTPILAAFTSKGVDGFTMAVDPRAADGTEQYMGIRLQYVPEISMRWNADLRRQLSVPGQLERVLIGKEKLLGKIVAQVAAMNGVASAITMRYDTLVIGKENYDEYIAGKPAAADSEPRTRVWFGQPIRSHVEAAASRYRAAEARQAALDDASGSEARLRIRSGEPAIRPGGGSDERSGVVLGTKQEGSATFNGVHYGGVKTDKLDAAKYGTGLQGSEARRLRDYWDDRIKKRVYFYIPKYDGTMPLPESGIGGHVYTQRFNNIASPAAMSKLYAEARGDANTMESLVVDAGYDGYAAPSMGMMVILNHDVPVNYEGIRSEYEAKTGQTGVQKFETDKFKQEKLSLRAPTTPEFKRWFGDSKVVDENGEPLVVYHSTTKDFSKFKLSEDGKAGRGIYMSEDPDYAGMFSGKQNKNTMPLYVSIKNPMVFQQKDGFPLEVMHIKYPDVFSENVERAGNEYIAQKIQDAGYDGIFIIGRNGTLMEVVAFEPTQIKSATGNIGTYDPTNPDIRYSLRKAPEWVPQNIWDLHEKASRADAESMGTAPSRVNAKDQAFSPGALKRNQVMSFRRLNDAVEKYVGNNEDDANALMVRMNQESGRREAEAPIRLSLRSQINAMPNGAAILTRLNETTTIRDEATHAQRMIDAIHPRNASSYRQKLIYRYQRIGEGTRARALTLGEQELLADVSAEAAALQSDMAAGMSASALGIGDRKGGIPVYKNGYTTIDNSVKGAVETFVPLAKSGDPLIYQLYQYWAGVKRGSRLMAPSPGHPNGREELFTEDDITYAKQIQADHPEFIDVQKDWVAYNNGLVRYMVDTGTITEAAGIKFMEHGDYLPFYRQLDGERTAGPQIFQSIAGVKPPKALKGGKAELADFLETVVRNTQAAIQSGMKNVAGQRVVRDAVDTQTAEKLPHFQSAYDVVTIMEKGLKTSYRVADPLLIEAMKGLNLPDIPFLSMVSGPANLLRNMVTKDPGFMLANMMKDSIGTWVQSGTKMKPITETVLQFGKALAGKSKEVEALLNAGFGGYEFSGNVEQNGRDLAKDLRKKSGTRTTSETAFRPFTSLWGALEKGSQASELATRAAVYKRVMDETGNEAEALHRALEVMNFNRKGNSALIRVLTAAVPFLNARMQGLDLLYRSAFGQMALKDAKSIQKAFFIRGATLMALSCFYYAMTHDDDEYKKQEQETRDNNWLIPSLGIKIPIPFEIGVLFKVVPERILAYAFGSDTGQDFLKSMGRQISSTLGFNPIPQAVLPIVENVANYSFFTSRTIIPRAMEGIDPKFQIQQSTSGLAMKIGRELGMSPIKIDHLINGYTGTLGVYMSSALNSIFDSNDDPTRADLRLYQMPVIKRFMLDPDAKGTVSEYFDLKHSVDKVVRTTNMLEGTSNFKEMGEYATENIKILATQDYIKDLAKDMKELQEFSVTIRTSNMDSASKRDALDNISKAQNALTANIQTIRKFTQQ